MTQTQGYLKDALLTVTQHLTAAAQTLTASIEQQGVELEGVDAMMRLVETRLATQKGMLGCNAMSLQAGHRQFAPKEAGALERDPNDTGEQMVALRTEDGRLDLTALDEAGELP